MFPSDISP